MKIIFVCCIAGLCLACSPRAIREARDVVAQADSLWHAGQMYGVDAGDSATLAQAYETLGAIPLPFREGLGLGSSYARSCYHYGRLLRAKEDPVAAMQVFINATHSHTRDYHILGRVYSNMGSICHLAGEYPLSYDMYEKSANMFLLNGDSVLYFYGLNNMAFELAEQGKKEETLKLLDNILTHCANESIIAKIYETKAELYLYTLHYDSTIYYAHKALSFPNTANISDLQLSQAYSLLSVKDSSVYYAQKAANSTRNLLALNNALYILTNDDTTKTLSTVRELSAKRSDIQKLLEIRRGEMAQAVQLLQQDINRKPDWLIYILITCLVIGIIAFVLFSRIWKKRRQQIQEQVISLTDKHADDTIEVIKKHIDKTDINTTLHWKNYASMKIDADLYLGGIVSKLEAKNLNETEIRYCILTLLDFPQKEKAEILYYGYPSAIKTLKRRIADKLETTPPKLQKFLFSMVANAQSS